MIKLITLPSITIADSSQIYPLSETKIISRSIIVEAPVTNTGVVSVGGGPDFNGTNGTSIEPKEIATIELQGGDSFDSFDLRYIYVGSTEDGDIVKISYIVRST